MFRVIIADDEKTIRNGLKKLIESYDLNLTVVGLAKDGEEALQQIIEHKPEIILMDINMPFINGLDIIEKVRDIVPDSKIIIISGYSEFEYAQKALDLGVYSYLLKPIDYKKFKSILKNAMEDYKERMWEVNKLQEDRPDDICQRDIGNDALSYIKKNFTDHKLSLASVADALFISQSYLTKLIKNKTGHSFTDYLNKLRIDMAVTLLMDEKIKYSIKDISDRVGFNSQHYFSRAFKNYKGVSPLQYRNKKSV